MGSHAPQRLQQYPQNMVASGLQEAFDAKLTQTNMMLIGTSKKSRFPYEICFSEQWFRTKLSRVQTWFSTFNVKQKAISANLPLTIERCAGHQLRLRVLLMSTLRYWPLKHKHTLRNCATLLRLQMHSLMKFNMYLQHRKQEKCVFNTWAIYFSKCSFSQTELVPRFFNS